MRSPTSAQREQWERFKGLPNLMYTDGKEWALYHSGTPVASVVTLPFDPTRSNRAAVSESVAHELLDLLGVFLGWSRSSRRHREPWPRCSRLLPGSCGTRSLPTSKRAA